MPLKVIYRFLRDNDRRRYGAIEDVDLGHGGTDYIAALLDCDPKTIRRGQSDLEQLRARPLEDIAPSERARKKGVETGPWLKRCRNRCPPSMPSWRAIQPAGPCARRSSV